MPPKVSGTQIRGNTYHLNLPIPAAIKHLYPEHRTGVMRGTLRTSCPREAGDQVNERRATFARQVKEVERLAARKRVLGTLGQEDQDLLSQIGGPEKLLDVIRNLRKEAAFITAGSGAYGEARAESMAGHAAEVIAKQTAAEEQASLSVLAAETRRIKRVASQLGEDTPEPPKGLDEGISGIQELADAFMNFNHYTVQNRESVALTVRRWKELHGDLPIEKWERRHLNEFDLALEGLPVSSTKEIRKLPIKEAAKRAKADNLPTISPKTRSRFIDHMKLLSKHALTRAGIITADPFAGYQPKKEREKHSTKKESDVIPFTAEQVGHILDHCAAIYDPDVIDYWLPMLAAYTGARREELGQLTVSNIRLMGNLHVLDITDDDPAQKLKNRHSLRVVPIPSPVIDAGFLRFTERRRQAGGHFLFLEDVMDKRRHVTRGEVEPDRRGRLTERYGHRFGRKVRDALGLNQPGLVFHSLRHSWTDAARRAGTDREIRRLIAGRLDGEGVVEAGYGGGDLLTEKLDALERIAPLIRK